MNSGKDFTEWLKEHYANVDSEKLAQIYESNYHPGDFINTYTAAFNTVNMKKWVESDKCTWSDEKKMDFALQYVYAKESCDQFEMFLRDQGLTKAKYNKWKSGKPTESHPPKNDIKKMFDELKKKSSNKKSKKTDDKEQSLKIKIRNPKTDKTDISVDKKEESKPKKE